MYKTKLDGMMKINMILSILISISLTYCYEIGETISNSHQNMEFDICYSSELDPNGDGIFNLAEYNGDLNGGDYYVIFLEMSASW